ncbi:hypothetical protein OROHE_005579 [Orobanche hederae]
MADVKAVDEGVELPEKRKVDTPTSINKPLEENKDESDSNKRQRIEVPSEKNGSLSHPAVKNVAQQDEHNNGGTVDDDDDENDDEEDYNAEEDEDGDEDVNEEAEIVDKKGKGIMRDDKGKGKMVEDSEDDDSDGHDDDDSSDDSDSDFSDGLDGSDLEDDPLAEVDLDNILPSRTRQRQMQPGVRILSDPNKGNNV